MPLQYNRLETIHEETPLACVPLNPDGIDAYVVQECSEAINELLTVDEETTPCLICNSEISLEGRRNHRVLKCGMCREATPILQAPPGRKYVRCRCNCLILCGAASIKIKCPRINCHKIITMATDYAGLPFVDLGHPNRGWVANCVFCHESFLCGLSTKTMIKCCYCKRRSSIGGYAQERARYWLRLTIINLIFNYLVLIPLIIWCPLEFISVWFLLFLPSFVFIAKTLKFTYKIESSIIFGYVERQWLHPPLPLA